MLISHTHNFAFIHVPKTAGVSVWAALHPYADHAEHYWANRWLAGIGIHVNHYAPYRLKKFRLHMDATTLERQLPAAVFANLFKFAFVRNPWDLLVSYYHYLQQSRGHHRHRRLGQAADFAAYVRYEIRRNKISQSRMLVDRQDRLLVDFVGRFESLASDFDWICRRIGVAAELPRHNRSRRGDYRSFYSDHLVRLVAGHFAEDIERFGYRFEDGMTADRADDAEIRRVA